MNLTTRAINILTKPATEWTAVETEQTPPVELILRYAAPLAAIPAIASFLSLSVIGIFGVRIPLIRGLSSLIVGWVLSLVGALVGAKVVEQLAPRFQSRASFGQALKLVVYASTPGWIAGVLNIVPALSPLMILFAIYAVYLFYLGLPRLMQTPDNQVIPYMVVAAIVMIVIGVVFGVINGVISGAR
jgi:hypothetical protein